MTDVQSAPSKPSMTDRCPDAEALKSEFLSLLNEGCKEQVYQSYLEKNPWLIPQEFVQNHGIHFDIVFRKLPFGNDYVSDFMYLAKSSVKWHCVLVEIEKPTSRFFNQDNSFHKDFYQACGQINDWRAWLNQPENAAYFLSNSTGFVQTPLGYLPTDFKYVLVHGRRREYQNSRLRRAKIEAQETADFRIMSFDSLVEGFEHRNGSYIAARKSERIEILSNRFVSENVFGWLEPQMVSVNPQLRSEIEARRDAGHTYRLMDQPDGSTKRVGALPYYLDGAEAS